MSSTVPARFPPLAALRAAVVSLLMFAGLAGTARAALEIEITSGVRDPVPIAVVPFARAVPADGGLDVAEVVQHDLEGSGRFKALAARAHAGHSDARRGSGGAGLEGRRQRLRGRGPRRGRSRAAISRSTSI